MSFDGIKKMFREVHSENGTLSWGRVAASFSFVATVVWVSKVVFQTHAIPDLAGPSLFTVGPYAAAKASSAVQSFSPNPQVLTQTGANPAPPSMLPTPPPPPPPAQAPVVQIDASGDVGATGATGPVGPQGPQGVQGPSPD